MKKLLSIVLAVAMLMSLLCVVPASAEVTLPANIGTDYVAGAITDNMFGTTDLTTTDVISGMYTPDNFTATIKDVNTPADSWYVWTKADVLETTATGKGGTGDANGRPYGTGVAGVFVNKAMLDTTSLAAGDGLVVIANVKANRAEPLVKAALTLTGESPLYPMEYPNSADGYAVTSTSAWAQVTNTFKLPDDWAGMDKTQIGFGYPYPNVDDGDKRIYLQRSTFYIGEEYAHDISVSPANVDLYTGKTVTVDADILNQGGSTGYLDQSVTWYATNAGRTEAATGFAIVYGEDGTAQVSIDSTVAEGTYKLVAVSDVNAALVKAITVTVTSNPYADYVPGAVKGNMFGTTDLTTTDVISGMYTPDNYTATIKDVNTPADSWYVWTKVDVLENTVTGLGGQSENSRPVGTGVAGVFINKSYLNTASLAAGDTLIVSANVKANRAEPIVKAALTLTGKSPLYPQEYLESGAGFTVTDAANWQTVNNTFKLPADWAGMGSTQIGFGYPYPNVDDGDKRIYLQRSTLYVGEEYAHDIDVTAPVTVWNEGETESLAVSASLTNQIGNAYSGEYDITWKAMNTDRTAEIEGITITPGVNGAATVTVADTVAAGTYDIVAVYGDLVMAKGVSITVEAAETIEGITLTPAASGVTVATDTALTDAKLIFVTYDSNGKMVDWEAVPVTLVAQKSEDYVPVDLTPGNYTKAMLWTDMTNCTPLADMVRY